MLGQLALLGSLVGPALVAGAFGLKSGARKRRAESEELTLAGQRDQLEFNRIRLRQAKDAQDLTDLSNLLDDPDERSQNQSLFENFSDSLVNRKGIVAIKRVTQADVDSFQAPVSAPGQVPLGRGRLEVPGQGAPLQIGGVDIPGGRESPVGVGDVIFLGAQQNVDPQTGQVTSGGSPTVRQIFTAAQIKALRDQRLGLKPTVLKPGETLLGTDFEEIASSTRLGPGERQVITTPSGTRTVRGRAPVGSFSLETIGSRYGRFNKQTGTFDELGRVPKSLFGETPEDQLDFIRKLQADVVGASGAAISFDALGNLNFAEVADDTLRSQYSIWLPKAFEFALALMAEGGLSAPDAVTTAGRAANKGIARSGGPLTIESLLTDEQKVRFRPLIQKARNRGGFGSLFDEPVAPVDTSNILQELRDQGLIPS